MRYHAPWQTDISPTWLIYDTKKYHKNKISYLVDKNIYILILITILLNKKIMHIVLYKKNHIVFKL
jgi:hypothetical protein